jgi:hypothetical protein
VAGSSGIRKQAHPERSAPANPGKSFGSWSSATRPAWLAEDETRAPATLVEATFHATSDAGSTPAVSTGSKTREGARIARLSRDFEHPAACERGDRLLERREAAGGLGRDRGGRGTPDPAAVGATCTGDEEAHQVMLIRISGGFSPAFRQKQERNQTRASRTARSVARHSAGAALASPVREAEVRGPLNRASARVQRSHPQDVT